VNPVRLPTGFRLERLRRNHPRSKFESGEKQVDEWLVTKALQNQSKRLSVTNVVVDESGDIAAYYTLASGQIDFSELPAELTKKLPRHILPVAVLAWLGVDRRFQGHGLGRLSLAQALQDCHVAGQTFPFVGVVLDCISDAAKSFYQQWDFQELPGNPYRLILSARQLDAMMQST
jgi:GNAT superfamily N-acetyltransferase